MKLLICTQALDKNHPILGFFHGWVLEFSKHFSEVHVICLEKGLYELPSHVHVYSLGKEEGESRLKYLYRFYKYFGHIFFTVRVDFVFFHMGAIYNILAFPFFIMRKIYKTNFYWWKTHGHINLVGKIALLFVDRVYTAVASSFPINTKKKYVVGHAIDTAISSYQKKQDGITKTILFVGRVTPIKNVEYVLKTAEILHSSDIDFCVRIVGVTPDTKYLATLNTLVHDMHLDALVTFVGPVLHADLKTEYQRADIVMNPSKTGGIDKVVLEAMSYGIPVVALEETYGTILSKFGLAIATQDASLYAKRIQAILEYSMSKQLELGSSLQKEVSDNHSLGTLTKRIFNI